MQKPSNDAVNSTCSANAPCHEGTTARDRAEDDLAACLQVEIHRLRLLDAMPNHADVIVSVYLHVGTDIKVISKPCIEALVIFMFGWCTISRNGVH